MLRHFFFLEAKAENKAAFLRQNKIGRDSCMRRKNKTKQVLLRKEHGSETSHPLGPTDQPTARRTDQGIREVSPPIKGGITSNASKDLQFEPNHMLACSQNQ